MTTDPERRLTDAMTALTLAAGLRARLETARKQAAASAERAEAAARDVRAEQQDVERLEHLTWARVWAGVRGKHSTELERERAEADAARFTADTERARARADAAEVEAIGRRLADLGDVQAAYAEALAAKERWLTDHAGPGADRLAAIAEELGTIAGRAREVQEARAAGDEAEHLLAQAAGLLGSAAGWATWDVMGGGMFADMAKHRKMNEAHAQLAAADRALTTFNRELADVMTAAAGELRVEGFSYTFDVWFDNVFSDMAVSSRIARTRDALGQTRLQLQVLRNRLRIEDRELEQRRTALVAERESLLTR